MNIFDFFSIFDWVTPVVESGKDIYYAVTADEPSCTIWLDRSNLDKRKLKEQGIYIISTTTTFGSEIGIDVPQSQVDKAREILGETW